MTERIRAARAAIAELLYDENVEWLGDNTYRVNRPGGASFLVMEAGDGWAVYHDHPVFPWPAGGIPGTQSSVPEYAIAWVLLDPWPLPCS